MKKCVLWLIWQNAKSRQNYHVGNLYHDETGYYFEYEKQKVHRGLQAALCDGYRPHLAFPDMKRAYYSPFLFSAFSRRLPSKSRPDFKHLLKRHGLPADYTDMDLLRATGGRLATDSYEFVSPIFTSENRFGFDFFVAGWRYYQGEALLHCLTEQSLVSLKPEPDNQQDPFAIQVLTEEESLLGYVPAYYSEFLTKILEHHCPYKLQIGRIDTESIPKLRMSILVDGYLTEDIADSIKQNFSMVPEELYQAVCE
ncbi:HIRAN domain-containing protein [Ectobacillus ponti]|uniref:HIRAN domain-containing protein n=1 Tax=Ectobacillus ponti TaxID=2961894 RepID=A0AA41XAI7_9BACI|nr:HIRAN domain-containing protein [Ectobacillus ponti]MCP8969920.1 HIRAN domain-containing protein [Ectobacillus ponti]